MNINRKTFIGGLVAGIASIGFDTKASQFEDIQIDRYYVLRCDNDCSYGYPGSLAGSELIKTLKYESNFRDIDEVIDELASREFRYEVSSYIFDKPPVKYNDTHLTKEWLTEFYNRHKDEDNDAWDKAYASKLNELSGVKA